VASQNWQPATIAGLPAAVGRPILDEGLGVGEVVIWDGERMLLTTVRTTDLGLAELLRIAEGVAK
jgi:hypothetical protein